MKGCVNKCRDKYQLSIDDGGCFHVHESSPWIHEIISYFSFMDEEIKALSG